MLPPLQNEAKAMDANLHQLLGKGFKTREWVGVKKVHDNMSLQTDVFVFPQKINLPVFQITQMVYQRLGKEFHIFGPKTDFVLKHTEKGQVWEEIVIFRVMQKQQYPWERGMMPMYKLYL